MIKRFIILIFLASGCIGLSSCSDSPKKTDYYTVTYVTKLVSASTNYVDGYRYGLVNQETGHPAYVFYQDLRFQKGEELIMKRTRKEVTFTLK